MDQFQRALVPETIGERAPVRSEIGRGTKRDDLDHREGGDPGFSRARDVGDGAHDGSEQRDRDALQAGLRAALESPLPVKLNCVPQVGVNEGELEAIAALARDNDLQVRFIEMMPIGYGAAMPCVSGPELRARFANRWPELHPVEGTTFGNGPAVYYTVPGWKGSIGFIAAVHGKFCASCNRVRLTSQGFLRPCLASETGCDLRALLRGGADDARLRTAIRETIWSKPREHHFEDRCMPATRSMYRIGG